MTDRRARISALHGLLELANATLQRRQHAGQRHRQLGAPRGAPGIAVVELVALDNATLKYP